MKRRSIVPARPRRPSARLGAAWWLALALVAAAIVAACGTGSSPTATVTAALPTTAVATSTVVIADGLPAPSPTATRPGATPNAGASPTASPPAASPSPTPPTGTALLADNAATANDALVDAPLRVPDGFDVGAHTLKLPPGYAISVLSAGLDAPRFMAFDAAGNLLVADAGAGAVFRYPAGADGAIQPAASPPAPLLTGLNAPSNVAFYRDGATTWLYVGETNQVSRFAYRPDGAPGPQQVVIPDLPTGGHSTRTIAFGPDGKLYLAVGSSCNICDEQDERRAAVLRYNPDGSGYERVAWGMRNPVGLAFQPRTGWLWATVNERDNQGNERPPDLVTVVQAGANYGWPTCQPPDATPQEAGDDCAGVTPPTVGIQPHSAPLGLAFAAGPNVPDALRGDLFVAQHGSWNREPPAEPKLLRIEMRDGVPVGATDFATGWQAANGDRWGRLAGVIVAPDGSIIVSDDTAGLLYRIRVAG